MSWQIRQKINFYSDEFRPPRLARDVSILLRNMALTSVLMLILAALALVLKLWMHSRVDAAQATSDALIAAIEQEQQRRPPLVADPQLQKELDKARQQLINSQRVLTYLSREGQELPPSFTALVSQLGDVKTDGIWLSGFSMDGSGNHIELRGFAQKAARVSPYVEALAQQPAYQGMAFRQVEINTEPGQKWLTFRLDTRAPAQTAEGSVPGGRP